NASFPIVRKKLCLVRGHVDIDGAVPLTTLTGQAEIQSLLDVFIAPALPDDVAMHHFPEQMCPSTCRVHLLARDHVTRAHRVLFPFAVFPAALPHTHAP